MALFQRLHSELLKQVVQRTSFVSRSSSAALLLKEAALPLQRKSIKRYEHLIKETETDRPKNIEPHLLYEPPEIRKTEADCHERINVVLHGYDYATLERFQSYVHRLARRVGLTVSDSWAVPGRTWKVVTYKPRSTATRATYEIAKYERTVQLVEVESTKLTLLINILCANQPMGVHVTLKNHEKVDEDNRYIPDVELVLAQKELASFDDPAVRRKKHWLVE